MNFLRYGRSQWPSVGTAALGPLAPPVPDGGREGAEDNDMEIVCNQFEDSPFCACGVLRLLGCEFSLRDLNDRR